MKESISNALILNIVIIFIFIMLVLFAGSTAYTKAFKVKNKIINIIERNENKILTSNLQNKLPSSIEEEIELALSEIGYRIETNHNRKCLNDMTNRFKNSNNDYTTVTLKDSSYNYCIAEFYDETSVMKGKYYAVITYMYFEVPLIGKTLEFPVYGETKTMGLAY